MKFRPLLYYSFLVSVKKPIKYSTSRSIHLICPLTHYYLLTHRSTHQPPSIYPIYQCPPYPFRHRHLTPSLHGHPYPLQSWTRYPFSSERNYFCSGKFCSVGFFFFFWIPVFHSTWLQAPGRLHMPVVCTKNHAHGVLCMLSPIRTK